MTKAKQSTK